MYGRQAIMSELLAMFPRKQFRITLIGLNMMIGEANAKIHPPNKLSGLLSARLSFINWKGREVVIFDNKFFMLHIVQRRDNAKKKA